MKESLTEMDSNNYEVPKRTNQLTKCLEMKNMNKKKNMNKEKNYNKRILESKIL